MNKRLPRSCLQEYYDSQIRNGDKRTAVTIFLDEHEKELLNTMARRFAMGNRSGFFRYMLKTFKPSSPVIKEEDFE